MTTEEVVVPNSFRKVEPEWISLLRLNAKRDALRENFKKISLYWRPHDTYWRLTNPAANLVVNPGSLGQYPLDFTFQLRSGHFASFDPQGLPLQRTRDGKSFIHNYTMMCGYALAHWEHYLESGDVSLKAKLLSTAQYILETASRWSDGSLALRAEKAGKGHVGELSSMFQGQAMSVLCRAWQATGDPAFREAAAACLGVFEVPVERGGVLGTIREAGIPWYEEYPTDSLNHVLNGMIFAVWGLHDLCLTTGNLRAKELLQTGVESIVRALPMFDNGFWSWYWIAESDPPYIASMTYHSLHICQLQALARQTGKEMFGSYAARFRAYANSVACRGRAIATMIGGKLNLAAGGRSDFTARLEQHNERFGNRGAE